MNDTNDLKRRRIKNRDVIVILVAFILTGTYCTLAMTGKTDREIFDALLHAAAFLTLTVYKATDIIN